MPDVRRKTIEEHLAEHEGKRAAVLRCRGCAGWFLAERRSAMWCSSACRAMAKRDGTKERAQ